MGDDEGDVVRRDGAHLSTCKKKKKKKKTFNTAKVYAVSW